MGTFWKLLTIELNSLDQGDFYEPDAEPREDDHVVGDLSEDTIRLYTLWHLTEKQAAEVVMEMKYGRASDDQKREMAFKANELRGKSGFIRELFWIEVKDEHRLWNKGNIGVRKDRKVVWYEERGSSVFGDLFGGLGL